jgi:ubiquinone/menaquinone biosynthesis C-methylase UbiE
MIEQKTSEVQSSYDRVAEEYARHLYDELRHKPLDRQLLDRFADCVRDEGLACDLGCGPGQVARYLHERGVEICGVDLSAGMVEHARQFNPGIEFHQGDMRSLDLPDQAWTGIVAFYAIVNLPPSDVTRALREMQRVLRQGGLLLLSFHIGEEVSHVDDLWGCAVCLDFYFFRTGDVAAYLRSAGFEIEEIVEREPYAPEVEYQSRRAYIFARKQLVNLTTA